MLQKNYNHDKTVTSDLQVTSVDVTFPHFFSADHQRLSCSVIPLDRMMTAQYQ